MENFISTTGRTVRVGAQSGMALVARAVIASAAMLSLVSLSHAGEAPSQALVSAREQIENPQISVVTFRSMERFFPTDIVRPADIAAPLPEQRRHIATPITLRGAEVAFDEALVRTYTNALLVIHDGRIVDERYLNGAQADDRFMSWSMAKSVTSILVGVALDRELIRSVDEPIETYLPELEGTAYEGVTIEQLLMMRDGTSYTEQSPQPPSTLDIAKKRSMYSNEMRFADITGLGLTRALPPGERFNYSTLTTGILGRMLEAATGKRLAEFTQEALWQPAGMQSEAYWLLDGPLPEGRALAGGGFNATLRDFGRIGLMMLNGGKANGRQIVSQSWVERSTRYAGKDPVIPGAPRGYQYQWWTMLGTQRFEAIGIHGQFMSIDPQTNSVIVKLSYWPDKGGPQYNYDTLALLDGIRAVLSPPAASE